MKIQVKSLPLKDVIHDIADALETSVAQNCEEYRLTVPSQYGEGHIWGINFQSGLGLIHYNCRFTEAVEIHFTVSKIHPAKFLYCTEGAIKHCFAEEENEEHHIEKYRHAIVASSTTNGHILSFKRNERILLYSLEVLREEFRKKVACDLETLEDPLRDMFEDTEAKERFYHEGFYSLRLASTFEEMDEFDKDGILLKFFLEGKSYQVLTQQIMLFNDSVKNRPQQTILRQSEVVKIQRAVDYIMKHLDRPLTVQQISDTADLNERKLQEGFKILKGQTVNSFIQEVRLEAARNLLVTSDLNVSEIVYSIGLNNRSYFARIFKERYEYSPTGYREMNQKD